MTLLEESGRLHPETVRLRRAIHRRPELAFEERQTAAAVLAAIRPLGLKVRDGIGGTGIYADLVADPKAPFVALRADMDALPIQEESGVEFASETPGKAHLCGHDNHVAMLVSAARILSARKKELRRNVRFLFQPSEEKPPGGALEMIRARCLDGVAELYGIHVDPRFPVGEVASRPGPMLAQSDCFAITIEGKGGHGSMPHLTVDPIPVAASLILALHTIPSRRASPADPIVLSVCKVSAGETFNAIPRKAELVGTTRTLRPETSKRIPAWIRQTAEHVAAAAGATASVDYTEGYPPVVNHVGSVERVKAACEALVGAGFPRPREGDGTSPLRFVECDLTMYGEDFAYYLQKVPGAFVFLGAGNAAAGITEPCHSPRFRIDEEALAIGPALLAQIALSAE